MMDTKQAMLELAALRDFILKSDPLTARQTRLVESIQAVFSLESKSEDLSPLEVAAIEMIHAQEATYSAMLAYNRADDANDGDDCDMSRSTEGVARDQAEIRMTDAQAKFWALVSELAEKHPAKETNG